MRMRDVLAPRCAAVSIISFLALVGSVDGAPGSLLLDRRSSSSKRDNVYGGGLIEGLLNAIHLMVEAPDWMASKKACADSVNSTLQTLANEYTDTHVSFILGTACDHYNIYQDFGGTEAKCKPVFKELGQCFDTDKDYRGWCEDTTSLLGTASKGGARAAAPSKASKVAVAKAEMKRVKAKRDRGEDIHEDLDKLKGIIDEAGDDAAAQRTLHGSDGRSKGGGGSVAPMSAEGQGSGGQDADAKVGGSRFGNGGSYDGHENPQQNYKSSLPKVVPFGTETVAGKFTKDSRAESNGMVDQIEKAQVAEEKRSAYRALTHLRHMTVSSFDGIAHTHMQNIHEYGETVKWRDHHPVQHLAEEEDDVGTWALPGPAEKPSQ